MSTAVNVKQLVKKWDAAKGAMSTKSISDTYLKENMAILLDNQCSKDFNGNRIFINENSDAATTTGSLDAAFTKNDWAGGDWRYRPVALALMRRTFPDLFANKVVGVQAMATPVGLAYALRFTYNKNGKGTEAAWDAVDQYSGFTGELNGVLGGVGTSATADQGTGMITSAGENCQISDGRTNCVQCDEDEWQQIGLRIDQTAITARTRKLAASFSLESAQDIKTMHGVDIEREMVNILQYEISAELDRELLQRLKSAATNADPSAGGVVLKNVNVADGTDNFGRWSGERYMSMISAIVYQSHQIAIATRRGAGNFVVVSPDVATALQAAGHAFVNYEQKVNPTTTMAAIGKLNGTIDVYRDQYATTSYALVGYKGPGTQDAGVIFSPYIMGLQNRAISPDDFSPRMGVMSRYAITDSLLGSGRYYRLINFDDMNKIIPGL